MEIPAIYRWRPHPWIGGAIGRKNRDEMYRMIHQTSLYPWKSLVSMDKMRSSMDGRIDQWYATSTEIENVGVLR